MRPLENCAEAIYKKVQSQIASGRGADKGDLGDSVVSQLAIARFEVLNRSRKRDARERVGNVAADLNAKVEALLASAAT